MATSRGLFDTTEKSRFVVAGNKRSGESPPRASARTGLLRARPAGAQRLPDYVMPKFSAFPPTPETTGNFEEMMLLGGESAGLVKEIRPAGEIVREMMDEARRIIVERLYPLADGSQ